MEWEYECGKTEVKEAWTSNWNDDLIEDRIREAIDE